MKPAAAVFVGVESHFYSRRNNNAPVDYAAANSRAPSDNDVVKENRILHGCVTVDSNGASQNRMVYLSPEIILPCPTALFIACPCLSGSEKTNFAGGRSGLYVLIAQAGSYRLSSGSMAIKSIFAS